MDLFNFLTFIQIPFLKKNWRYNHATVSSIARKILVCDMGSREKDIYKICKVTFTLKNVQKRKTIKKNYMDSEKLIYLF